MEFLRELAHELGCGVPMVASDEVAVIPSDVVWKLTGKKLKLMADNRITDERLVALGYAAQLLRAGDDSDAS